MAASDRSAVAMFVRIDAAFRTGDLHTLRELAGDAVPNGPMPVTIGSCLEYAIYHSPLPFIRTLLEMGADPNPQEHAGFPPLIAALSCVRSGRGMTPRSDVTAIIELLLAFGADPDQRGINDYTPLHMAVAERHPAAITALLRGGADASRRTRIDDYETPREMAERAGFRDLVAILDDWERR